MNARNFLTGLCLLWLSGCGAFQPTPNMDHLYSEIAQQEDPMRNPVIVIPGILGSRLVDSDSGETVWGAFGSGTADPTTPVGAQLLALPMAEEKSLRELRDSVRPNGALDRVMLNFIGIPLQLNAYYNILQTLGVGGYRDQDLGESHAVDYGDMHYTCFQFAYDWRRDIVESAQALDHFIKEKEIQVRQEIFNKFGVHRETIKFDLVAHSMGSLVARYYLRYGAADLPDDGSLPPVTWAGAQHVDHLVMIGPPNAGSVDTLTVLVEGLKPAPLLTAYPSAVVGTMPSVYQLLPRGRHRPLLDHSGQPVEDLFDPQLWVEQGWGLADAQEAEVLTNLFPHITDEKVRRRIALDHQRKALIRAKHLTAALDSPAVPPPSLQLFLVAGDSMETIATLQIEADGKLQVVEYGPGDDLVLRRSALMDERKEQMPGTRLISPISWSQVLFVFSDHIGITEDPAFVDNILYFLLESPRMHSVASDDLPAG